MDNPEEVMQILERFNVSRNPEITAQLEEYITFVARTGDSVYAWNLVKNLYREKLMTVITDFYNETPTKGKQKYSNNKHPVIFIFSFIISELPQYPNVDPFNYETMKKMLIEKLDSFAAAPFTIQRISELLSDPRKQYSRIDKFMRAVEKTILVVSTVPPGRHRSESENGDSLDSALNGDFSTEVNVDIDMDHDGTFTKGLSAHRKESNHEVSEASKEVKKNVSLKKEDAAGTSESVCEKSQKEEVVKVSGKELTTDIGIASTELKSNHENELETKAAPENTSTPSTSQGEEHPKKEIPIVQETADNPTIKPTLDETPINEPIRLDNEILVDNVDVISQTTPLAALENIVAVRTEPVADVLEKVELKSEISTVVSPEPETNENREEIIVQASAVQVKDESESEPKRLKITEESTASESEVNVEAEKVVQVEQPVTDTVEEPVKATEVVEASVETQVASIPPIEAAVETISPVIEPVVEEKIDEPIPEIAEIPIEIVPPSEDIAEATTEMETVPTISENKMSLDEDEPPAIELEMTPIANKMDTDDADAAPMDFEDSSNEPMDQ